MQPPIGGCFGHLQDEVRRKRPGDERSQSTRQDKDADIIVVWTLYKRNNDTSAKRECRQRAQIGSSKVESRPH